LRWEEKLWRGSMWVTEKSSLTDQFFQGWRTTVSDSRIWRIFHPSSVKVPCTHLCSCGFLPASQWIQSDGLPRAYFGAHRWPSPWAVFALPSPASSLRFLPCVEREFLRSLRLFCILAGEREYGNPCHVRLFLRFIRGQLFSICVMELWWSFAWVYSHARRWRHYCGPLCRMLRKDPHSEYLSAAQCDRCIGRGRLMSQNTSVPDGQRLLCRGSLQATMIPRSYTSGSSLAKD
jgi:hypothetical protein